MSLALVTGATGLLGSSLIPVLREHQFEVKTHGFSQEADVNFDLSNRKETIAKLDTLKPAFILNLAGATNVDQCESDPNLAFAGNVKSAENLSEWLRNHSDTRCIHISTDQVYDGEGPHREDQVTIRNTYALTKYAGELPILGSSGCVLRTNLFGRSQNENKGSFTDWIFQSLQNSQDHLQGFDDIQFSPLSLETLSNLIANTLRQFKPGLFNLGSLHGLSKYKFMIEFAKAVGLDVNQISQSNVSQFDLKAERPKDMRMNCDKYQKEFKVALPTLNEEIVKAGKHYESNRK